MNVVVNGLMTSYQKVGNGKEIIVCIHGWGDSGKAFSGLIEELSSDYTFLILDLPGFGGTQPPDGAWGTSDYAAFVAAWLKKINAPVPLGIIAHSFGGAVAIMGLSKGTLKSKKLILIASSGIRDIKRLRKMLLKATAKAGKIPLYIAPVKTRTQTRKKFYRAIQSDRFLLPHMEKIYRKIITEDVQKAAHTLKLPTLLIYGCQDKGSPPLYGQILNQAINKSRLEIITGSGHFLHQEQPRQVAKLIKDFLG